MAVGFHGLGDGTGIPMGVSPPSGDRYLLESGAPDGYLLEDGSGVLLLEAGSAGKVHVAWHATNVLMTGDANRARVAWQALDVISPLEERARAGWLAVDTLMKGDANRARASWLAVDVLMTGDSTIVPAITVHSVLLEALVASLPEPEQPSLARTYTNIAELRWGRDLVLTYPDAIVLPTASGDWPTIAGRPNLHAAQRRRIVTTPGQLVHRPDYGGGLETYVGELNSPSERARLAAEARENALRDPRLEEASVSVTSDSAGRVDVRLAVRPAGEIEPEIVSIQSET